MKPVMAAAFALLLIVFMSRSALAGTDITIVPALTNVAAGNNYTIDVMVSTDQDIITYDILIAYDTEVLDFVGIASGDFQQNGIFLPDWYSDFFSEEEGFVNIVSTATSDPSRGTGILATITFHANESGPSGLRVASMELLGYDNKEIDPAEDVQPPAEQQVGNTGNGYTGGGFSGGGACVPQWNCTEWSICSGGIQEKTCRDLSGCKADFIEEVPCGGSAYHGNYPGEVYLTTSGPGVCNEGARVCGNGGVVECREGRLVTISTCEFGCEKGICLSQNSQTGNIILDPAVTLYAVLIGMILVFGGLIAFYGLK